MIEFIVSVPWWGWLIVVFLIFRFIFVAQMQYIERMTPEERAEWLAGEKRKKPWYMMDN